MATALWAPVAVEDLDDILYYIGVVDRNPETAERIYFEIRDRANEQADSSFPGHRHPQSPNSWRYVKHKRWLIFFKSHPDGIEVMRVIDGVRDLPRQFPNE